MLQRKQALKSITAIYAEVSVILVKDMWETTSRLFIFQTLSHTTVTSAQKLSHQKWLSKITKKSTKYSKFCNILGAIQDPSDLLQYVTKDPNSNKHFCSICNGFSHQWKSNVRNHVEALHFPDTFSYQCDLCQEVFKSKKSLENHRSLHHKGLK